MAIHKAVPTAPRILPVTKPPAKPKKTPRPRKTKKTEKKTPVKSTDKSTDKTNSPAEKKVEAPNPPPPPFFLRQLWRPRRSHSKARSGLGIGIVTYNRLEAVKEDVRAIESLTQTPYHLVIVDDGSTDGTASWARDHDIPVITGRNRGISANKNRALQYFLDHTDCDPILLFEDDCRPSVGGWEKEWISAVQKWGHLSNKHPGWHPNTYSGEGSAQNPFWSNILTAQVTIFEREVLQQIGYLDTRFKGYGHEHVEHSHRASRLLSRTGRWPRKGNWPTWEVEGEFCYPTLSSGIQLFFAGTYLNAEQIEANGTTMLEIGQSTLYRPPARNPEEWDSLQHEIQRSLWPQNPEKGAPLVSVICATRNQKQALALHEKMKRCAGDAPWEMVWAWTGDKPVSLPGVQLNLPEKPFSYEEAINRAVMESTGEILLIVNDDVQLNSEDKFNHLLSLYKERPELGACFFGYRH